MLDTAIARTTGDVVDGDEVALVSDRGEPIARGIFNGHSQIRVRLYGWNVEEPLDAAFFRLRL